VLVRGGLWGHHMELKEKKGKGKGGGRFCIIQSDGVVGGVGVGKKK